MKWSDEVLGTFKWSESYTWVMPMETPFATGFLELMTPDDVVFSDPPPPPSEAVVRRARWLQDELKPRWLEFADRAAKIANLVDGWAVVVRLARLDLIVHDTGWHVEIWLNDEDDNPPNYDTDTPIEVDGSPTGDGRIGGADPTKWSDEVLGTFIWSEDYTTWVRPMETPLAKGLLHLSVPNGEEYSDPVPTPSEAVVERARWLQDELKPRWMEFAEEAAESEDLVDGWAVVSRLARLDLCVQETGWSIDLWLNDEDGNPPDYVNDLSIWVGGSPAGPGPREG